MARNETITQPRGDKRQRQIRHAKGQRVCQHSWAFLIRTGDHVIDQCYLCGATRDAA